MVVIIVIIVSVKVVYAVAIAVVILASGIAVYLQSGNEYPGYTNPSFSELKAGAHIIITENDTKMLGGANIINFETNGYYAIQYHLDVNDNSIITGSWTSTAKSLVWVMIDGAAYMATPLPDATHGSLNQTLLPGQYTLVIGGGLGDVISIVNPIQIQSYVPQQIGDFNITAGTHINSETTFSFYLDQPGQLVGVLTTPAGVYSISLYSSSGSGFSTASSNSSAKPATISFSLSPYSQIFAPGHYNLTLSSGFYVSQTLKFLQYYDYSTS